MAERNQKVFERVRQELGKNPALGSRELYETAQQVDKSIAQDSLQQFHARYVLPVKREQRGGAGGGGARKRARPRKKAQPAAAEAAQSKPAARRAPKVAAPEGSDRDRVRAVLLQFAQELTDAESRSSLVQVLGRVEKYVSRIVPDGK